MTDTCTQRERTRNTEIHSLRESVEVFKAKKGETIKKRFSYLAPLFVKTDYLMFPNDSDS